MGLHVKVALGITDKENLQNIRETAKHFVKNEKEFLFVAEHFDGYKNNPIYALDCVKQAYDENVGLFCVILMAGLFLMK